MTAISRSNFSVSECGKVGKIEAFSNRVTLRLGKRVKKIDVTRRDDSQPSSIEITTKSTGLQSYMWASVNDINVNWPDRCDLRLVDDAELDYRTISHPSLRLWPLARRLLVEMRDRVLPMVDAILKH